MNDQLRRSEQHEVGVPCICGFPGDGSGPLWLVFHSSTPHQENQPPPASFPICEQEKGVEYASEHLAQFTGEGRAGSRLTKHWGPLNTCEWPQLYPGPSES